MIASPEQVVSFARPLYLVLCHLNGSIDDDYDPIDTGQGPDGVSLSSFDDELLPVLPGIWYALHLPKTRYEVLDLSLRAITEYTSENRKHHIRLAPVSLLDRPELMRFIVFGEEPITIICPEDTLEQAAAVSDEFEFVLPPIALSQLSQFTLDQQWAALAEHWAGRWPLPVRLSPLPGGPAWSEEITMHGSGLPLARLRRLLNHEPEDHGDRSEGLYASALELFRQRVITQALADLEGRGVGPDEVDQVFNDEVSRVRRKLRIPLTISLAGTSPRYLRSLRELQRKLPSPAVGDLLDPAPVINPEDPVGTQVRSLMLAHQASGDESMGVLYIDPIPPEAFHALASLERHWVQGPKPWKERKLRAKLDETMKEFWTDEFAAVLRSTSRIDAFTNFPIGLLRPPGFTAPLAAVLPITYRPLMPLTRALQHQLNPELTADLSDGFKVLIAECIRPGDPAGDVSRHFWDMAVNHLTSEARSIVMALEETLDIASLREAIENHRPDILIISAHGFHLSEMNFAGLIIGDQPTMGHDLGPMPPLVILSACHSGPRGEGPVAVTDLLVRAGALAVISTLVPVRADRNGAFMFRLLLYLCETVGRAEEHQDLLEVWQRVQTNSVVLDILHGNRLLAGWGHTRLDGISPQEQFMGGRSSGRLRPDHLYEDAEKILVEIAEEQGLGEKVSGWLKAPGYLPESMMYTMVGDPTRIRLRPLRHSTPAVPVDVADDE